MFVIKNVHVSVGEKKILNGVSLTVKPGEIHAIMGPNGSGKSTLAYSLAGHPNYTITAGSIKLNKVMLNELSPDQRAREGLFLAFQYPVEVAGVSVQNFLRVAYEAKYGKLKSILEFRSHIKELAKELKVKPELVERSLNEGFSGGEKKRVEILQMAVLQPAYAILDETDSGLDVDAIRAVAEGVQSIRTKYNTGMVVITHYQRILKYLQPDFVHVMAKGKIVKSGQKDLAEELERNGYAQYV